MRKLPYFFFSTPEKQTITMRFSLFLFATLLLVACEKKDTVFIKNIDNKSSKTIHFYLYGNINPPTYGDTITVNAGELKEINYYTEENSVVGVQQPCHIYNDSIRVEVVGGGILQKKLTQDADWTFSTQNSNEQVCTFEITDADIQ